MMKCMEESSCISSSFIAGSLCTGKYVCAGSWWIPVDEDAFGGLYHGRQEIPRRPKSRSTRYITVTVITVVCDGNIKLA